MPLKRLSVHLVVWLGVFAVWLAATRPFHPTLTLAICATAVLVSASAAAVYINHLFLLPKYAHHRRWWHYATALLVTVAVLDLVAVPLIQFLYDWLWGPDPRRFGFWFNVSSDGAIIVMHLIAAAALTWTAKFLRPHIRQHTRTE